MNSRWSADSSTNETTAERPRVAPASVGQSRVVEPHRDFRGEILELVAGQPEFGEDDEVGTALTRLGEQVVVGREVDLERPEPRRDLGKRDPACLHVREHTR